jgi:multisubunit Na+/H+ antiporter MnhB subunit
MSEQVSRDDIVRIEERIDELREQAARCAKLSLAAKVAIGAGGAWLALTVLWLVPFTSFMLVAAMAAVIGGIVLLGSNATTWNETEAALRASEAMRAEWIGRLELRVVEERPTLH